MKNKIDRRTMLKASGTAIIGALGATAATVPVAARYIGQPIYTTENTWVRTGAGTENGHVATAAKHTGGRIVGGPIDEDGFRWWKCQMNGDTDNGRVTGWIPNRNFNPADITYPSLGYISSDYYDSRSYDYHSAVDIANDYGTPVKAALNGTAHTAYEAGGCGNYVYIDHEDGYRTLYCHLQSFSVSDGQSVSRNQEVGRMGASGSATGPHVHFEVNRNGSEVYVPGETGVEVHSEAGVGYNYPDL